MKPTRRPFENSIFLLECWWSWSMWLMYSGPHKNSFYILCCSLSVWKCKFFKNIKGNGYFFFKIKKAKHNQIADVVTCTDIFFWHIYELAMLAQLSSLTKRRFFSNQQSAEYDYIQLIADLCFIRELSWASIANS